MKYSIKDVARIAGVSPSTVSRSINGTAYVDPLKKKKVLETIEKLNYVPNFAGKSLKDGSSRIIAVILPDLTNPYFTKLSQCLEKYINDNTYLMILALSHNDYELEKKYFEQLSHGIADGIVFIPTNTSLSASYEKSNIPIVVVNREMKVFDHVVLDNEKAAYDSISYLIKMGHTKIVSYLGDMKNPIYQSRKRGIIKALSDNNIIIDEYCFRENVLHVKDAYNATNKIIDSKNRPTAFFTTMDLLASGIYSSITEHNLKIPNDVSVMGFDNILMTENLIPPLTTYDHPTDLTAQHAIQLLINQIHHDSEKKGVTVTGSIIERDSVRKL